MEKERKIPVNICLPYTFLNKVDSVRGNVPRSEYLRDFIIKNLDLKQVKAV